MLSDEIENKIEESVRKHDRDVEEAVANTLLHVLFDKVIGGADGEMVVKWSDIKAALREVKDGTK